MDLDNSSQDTEISQPEGSQGSPQEVLSSQENTQAPQTIAEKLADLSNVERVRWKGKEFPVNDVMSGFQRQATLQKQYQEQQRFVENLSADVEKVAKNPALAEAFKEVYPKQYHWVLSKIQGAPAQSGANGQQQTPTANSQLDPRVEQALQKIEAIDKDRFETQVSARMSEIDSAFSKFSGKYPLATPNGDESYVIARAQSLVDSGEKITEKAWENLFKDAHTHFEKAYEAFYKTKFEKQNAANVRGKESARGGGIPGSAPNSPKTIGEATKIALQDLAPQR